MMVMEMYDVVNLFIITQVDDSSLTCADVRL